MFLMLVFILSVIAGILTGVTGHAAWQAVLAALGCFVGLNLLYVIWWVLVAAFVDDSKPIEKQSALCRFGCGSIAAWLCNWARVHAQVIGTELLPKEGRFVYVCNHRSGFDPVVTAARLRLYNLAFISKPSNLRIPVLGRIALGDCFLPIDRENDREALKSILCAADYLKRDLCSICIYPEGTRSKTRQMLPFHHGSFKIAQRAHVPLVIAAVSGTDMVKKNALRRFTDVYIDILELIPAEEVRARTTAELSDHAYAAIAEALEKREGKA